MYFEDKIKELLKAEVKEDITLETPPDPEFGDIAFPCFQLSKTLKKNPAEIAKDLAKKLKPTEDIEKIVEKGPYVNFFVNNTKRARRTKKYKMMKYQKIFVYIILYQRW